MATFDFSKCETVEDVEAVMKNSKEQIKAIQRVKELANSHVGNEKEEK